MGVGALLVGIQGLYQAFYSYKLCKLSLLIASKQLYKTLNSLHPYLLKILFKISYISPIYEITTRDRYYMSIHCLAQSIFHLLLDRLFTLLHYYYLTHNVILAYLSITHPPSPFLFYAGNRILQLYYSPLGLWLGIQGLYQASYNYKLCELSLLVAGKQLYKTLNSLHPSLLKILFKISHISPMCKMTIRDRRIYYLLVQFPLPYSYFNHFCSFQ